MEFRITIQTWPGLDVPLVAKMKKTIVGDRIRIGSNSTILPVKIGNNVIIGAGSVVTKDIPDNCIAYGNPAKIKIQK